MNLAHEINDFGPGYLRMETIMNTYNVALIELQKKLTEAEAQNADLEKIIEKMENKISFYRDQQQNQFNPGFYYHPLIDDLG